MLERGPSSSSQNPPEHRGLLYIPFSVLGVLWLLSRFHAPTHNPNRSDEQGDDTNNEHTTRKGDFMTVPQVPPSPTNPANAAQCKYERTPTWEKVLAIVGVSAALIYAGISLMMWCEMQKQTGILNRQFVSNDRAWIGVGSSSIPYPVTYPDGPNKPVFTVRYTLKNVGHSPAFVDVKGRIFYSKSGEWRREQEELCNAAFEKAKSVGRKWGKDAYTILPG